MFLKQDDVLELNKGTTKALEEMKERLGLPLNGYIVFPRMYMSKTCLHLTGRDAVNYKHLAYKLAGFIMLFGGPHMYLVYKAMEPAWIDAIFSIQVMFVLVYFYKRHVCLKQAKLFNLNVRPLDIYTDRIPKIVARKSLVKALFGFLLFFGVIGGFFTYSVFMKGYYFLFLFFAGSILWLSAGAFIITLAIKKSFIQST